MDKKGTATTADVAEKAGVSRLTVSKVINNRGGVAQVTVEAVRRAMEKLGYAPDQMDARRGPKPKDSQRRFLAAFVTGGVYESVLRSEVYHSLSMAIEHALSENGYSMVTRRLPPGSEMRPDLENVDGAIILSNLAGVPNSQTKPYVQVMGVPLEGESWDHISYDDYQVGVLAAEYLLEAGHSQCALFCATKVANGPRHRGFIQTILNRTGAEPLVLTDENLYTATEVAHKINLEAMNDRLDRFCARTPRPSGMFIDADMVTAALYPLLYARGIVPGRDLAVISCNNEQATLENLIPRPPSVDIHTALIGRKAVEQLFYRINNPTEPAVTIKYQPTVCF